MTEQTSPEVELDIRGMLCPMPLVRLSQKMETMEIGTVLRTVSDDPVCLSEIPAWARAMGQEMVSAEKEGGVYVFMIRRAK